MINVTKAFLPPLEEYHEYMKGIWQRAWLTNYGPLTAELQEKLITKLDVPHLSFCTNGTIALQIALKALDVRGEVITTPFSYVATTNSILWENCRPVFVDVNADDLCIDSSKIEERITEHTSAILAVHVYGFPCDVEAIEKIATKHNLKVIYDGAHAFGVKYKDRSLLAYGDVSTCSFHATKLYHTGEGGAIMSTSPEVHKKIQLCQTFGHVGDEYFSLGINGKNSEFHAAMGLCNLPWLEKIIERRKILAAKYDSVLRFGTQLSKPHSKRSFEYNYAYYPVLFASEKKLLAARELLQSNEINTRRYFYPSLNTLSFLQGHECPVSEDVSLRVLALPMYYDLAEKDIERICNLINSVA